MSKVIESENELSKCGGKKSAKKMFIHPIKGNNKVIITEIKNVIISNDPIEDIYF